MVAMMKDPVISERFDLEDIRKIRTYNAVRYEHMTPAEIVAEESEPGEKKIYIFPSFGM